MPSDSQHSMSSLPTTPPNERLGFGTMSLGINPDVRPSKSSAVEVLRYAADLGYMLFDTADSYSADDSDMGYTESLIREAGLTGRKDILIATKGGYERPNAKWARRADPAYLKFACERSLKHLGFEQIELYFLHAPDHDVPYEDSVGALAELKQEGKIKHVGLSNVTLPQIEKARAIVDIAAMQNPINIAIGFEEAMVRYCEKMQIKWFAYAPLGGYKNAAWLVEDFPILIDMAKKYDASPYQIALAWLLSLSPMMYPIPGSRDKGHVEHNFQATTIELSKVDRELLTFEALDSDMPDDDEEGEGDQLVQLI